MGGVFGGIFVSVVDELGVRIMDRDRIVHGIVADGVVFELKGEG
ncbi:hypothetical protein [Bacillus pumilus]|nr:hypothetical protein [Bacillus pumilus]